MVVRCRFVGEDDGLYTRMVSVANLACHNDAVAGGRLRLLYDGRRRAGLWQRRWRDVVAFGVREREKGPGRLSY